MSEQDTALAPVVVRPSFPAEVVVLTAEVKAEVAELVKASAMEVKDAGQLEAANLIFVRLTKVAKGIEDGRLALTRPIDEIKASIIQAQRDATEPLRQAREDLGKRIVSCQIELQRIKEEAEKKAREEAEAKARAEREKQEAERQAEIKRQQEEYQKQCELEKEAAERFGTDFEPPPPPPPPPPVVVIPEVIPPGADVPALPKAAVTTATKKKLVIVDLALVPFKIQDRCLWVLDEKAALEVLKAGIKIPGLALDDVASIRAVGKRR